MIVHRIKGEETLEVTCRNGALTGEVAIGDGTTFIGVGRFTLPDKKIIYAINLQDNAQTERDTIEERDTVDGALIIWITNVKGAYVLRDHLAALIDRMESDAR